MQLYKKMKTRCWNNVSGHCSWFAALFILHLAYLCLCGWSTGWIKMFSMNSVISITWDKPSKTNKHKLSCCVSPAHWCSRLLFTITPDSSISSWFESGAQCFLRSFFKNFNIYPPIGLALRHFTTCGVALETQQLHDHNGCQEGTLRIDAIEQKRD